MRKLTPEVKNNIKQEVGELLYDLVLKDTSDQRSAVTGQKWKGLSKDYKKIKQKTAPGIANLELTGDMLDAFQYKTYRDGLEIGIFDNNEAQKADNHCKFSAKSKKTALPKRQFVPNKGESFRSGILKELKALAEGIADENISELESV